MFRVLLNKSESCRDHLRGAHCPIRPISLILYNAVGYPRGLTRTERWGLGIDLGLLRVQRPSLSRTSILVAHHFEFWSFRARVSRILRAPSSCIVEIAAACGCSTELGHCGLLMLDRRPRYEWHPMPLRHFANNLSVHTVKGASTPVDSTPNSCGRCKAANSSIQHHLVTLFDISEQARRRTGVIARTVPLDGVTRQRITNSTLQHFCTRCCDGTPRRVTQWIGQPRHRRLSTPDYN